MMMPDVVGLEHFNTTQNCVKHMIKNNSLADIISILGIDELSEADKNIVYRSKKMEKFFSQPFAVAEVFLNVPGKLVELKETIKSFKAIMDGEFDNFSDTAFYFVGGSQDVIDKNKKIADDAEKMRLRQLKQEQERNKTKEASVKA